MADYIYIGDRLTDPLLKNKPCNSVRRNNKCIRGNSKMLVTFDNGKCVVLARRLRKIIK
jgi:hypothetical protein